MDLKLMICVAVVAVVSVGARSVKDHRCLGVYCEYGFEPGYTCRCRGFPFQLCDFTQFTQFTYCPPNTRCEALGSIRVCLPTDPLLHVDQILPVDPIMPVDPILPVDRIMPVDPVLPVDPIVPNTVCELPKKTGPCEAYIPRYFYNSARGRCERFIYGGCHANENNFQTAQECRARCIPLLLTVSYGGP